MTALTMPTRPGHDARLRAVPWRRMAWVTWRQHRAALAGVAVFLGALAVYLWLTGLQIHHAYATACHPASSLACTINFTGRYGPTAIVVSIFLQAVPALIGAFAGAPVLAREMETGTFRFAWTQGFGRWRWTLAKLVLLAVVVAAAAAAFSVLYSWFSQPFFAAGYTIPFATRVFDLGEVAFAAWTLAAFAIGALAGMLIRRTVPAIAATLAVYAALASATALYLRQHYMTPLHTSKLNLPGSAWLVSQWYTKGGKFAFGAHGFQLVHAVSQLCPPRIGTSGLSPAQCLTQHGYTAWTSYQPGSRFWPFQWIEGGWLLALSVLLLAATIVLVRRRAA
ncbi:MAG TPA: ABC transporter permease subunit [Streptosporangiaceae bacterium]|nr:ABC transporter permease subunit [Streptosporangiaceae bacterium]